MKYSKPPLSPEQHVALWQSRGLLCTGSRRGHPPPQDHRLRPQPLRSSFASVEQGLYYHAKFRAPPFIRSDQQCPVLRTIGCPKLFHETHFPKYPVGTAPLALHRSAPLHRPKSYGLSQVGRKHRRVPDLTMHAVFCFLLSQFLLFPSSPTTRTVPIPISGLTRFLTRFCCSSSRAFGLGRRGPFLLSYEDLKLSGETANASTNIASAKGLVRSRVYFGVSQVKS